MDLALNEARRWARFPSSDQLAHFYVERGKINGPRQRAIARYGIFSASKFPYALATYPAGFTAGLLTRTFQRITWAIPEPL